MIGATCIALSPLSSCGADDVLPSSTLADKLENQSLVLLSSIESGPWTRACFLDPYDAPRKAMQRYDPAANSFEMENADLILGEGEFGIAYVDPDQHIVKIVRYSIGLGKENIYMIKGERCISRTTGTVRLSPEVTSGTRLNTLQFGRAP